MIVPLLICTFFLGVFVALEVWVVRRRDEQADRMDAAVAEFMEIRKDIARSAVVEPEPPDSDRPTLPNIHVEHEEPTEQTLVSSRVPVAPVQWRGL